jgi:ribonuclease BN (tRNA processing enzyme)
LGYRLDFPSGKSLVYVTDNELAGGEYEEGPHWRQRFEEFIGDTDLLIHDSTYTPEEYPRYRGWGHSTYAEAVELAVATGAKRLALFHHEPEHGDAAMDQIIERAQEIAARQHGRLEVMAAAEGMTVTL